MSSNNTTGQNVGYLVGAVVGYVVGDYYDAALLTSALLGASIGGAVGGAIDPPKGPKLVGPRLSDLSQQGSTYGAPIPRVYGSMALMGNIFWIENNRLKETSKTEGGGGKGGGGGSPETTTYSYSATFAVGLCAGPIAGVRRIWISGDLIYDAGASDVDTVMASNQAAVGFRLYTGTETQEPSPRMQAALGAANVPAYRGLAYLVFEDLALEKYGNTLLGAQIKVEVVVPSASAYLQISNTVASYAANGRVGSLFSTVVWVARSTSASIVSSDGGKTFVAVNKAPVLDEIDNIVAFKNKLYLIGRVGVTGLAYVSDNGIEWRQVVTLPSTDWRCSAVGDDKLVMASFGTNWLAWTEDGIIWVSGQYLPAHTQWNALAYNGSVWCAGTFNSTFVAVSENLTSWSTQSFPVSNATCAISMGSRLVISNASALYKSDDDGLTWQLLGSTTATHHALYEVDGWLFAASSSTGSAYSSDGGATWALLSSVAMGISSFNGSWVILMHQPFNRSTLVKLSHVPDVSQSLSSIVQAECLLSGVLEAADLDVSELTDNVRGYRLASVAAIRSGIEALQGAWPFDAIQSGYKIKFKRRGAGASVVTIPESDLNARDEKTAGGVRLAKTREMDTQLPWRVNISHLDYGREYDFSDQYAERLNTDAVNIQSIEMPIVLTAAEAAQKAEILLYMYWLERYDASFSLPPSYNHLEPADVVTVSAGGATYQLRLTGVHYTSKGYLECTAKFNDNATYVSTSVGVEGMPPVSTIAVAGPSVYQLLDIPLLKDAYDTPGFPVAMAGQLSGWLSGSVYRSLDGGQTFAFINGFSSPSVIGAAITALAAPADTRMMDKTGLLDVRLYHSTLSSVTEAQLLNGANHFAYGADGRWEIIAAQNCVLLADGSYRLSDFLRGRFGTEWAVGTHTTSDRLVGLDENTLQFCANSLNQIGLAAVYRGITTGQGIDSADDLAFTYQGVNLECLSPVWLNGSRHPSTNDWSLDWIRRTRVGGEWRDLVDATLGEASQSYEVDIFSSAAYTTLKRTISGLTTPAASYTSAQQVTDFGSNQATLYVKIYQLSANVGRGYPLTTSITR